MSSDPYRDLADVFEGAVSMIDYYARRMSQVPTSVEAAKVALLRTITHLRNKSEQEFPEQ